MSARISVFSLNGSQLDSTTPRKARVLLQQGAARKIWRDGIFGIQLLTGSRSETTPAHLSAKLVQLVVLTLTLLSAGWVDPVWGRQGKKHQPKTPPQVTAPITTPPAQNPVVQIKSPQDTIPFDSTKIHEVKVAFGFMCVVALPEPATDLLVGNLVNFKVSPLVDNDAPAVPNSDLVNVSGDPRYVLIRPRRSEDVLATGEMPETNVTIKLTSERFLVFRVKVGSPSETCYRITVTDPTIEAKNRATQEAVEASARERERAERAIQAREELVIRSFKGMAERLQNGSVTGGTPFEPAKEIKGRLVVEKFDGFFVAGIVFDFLKPDPGKKLDLTGPAWTIDGQLATPRLMEGGLPSGMPEKGKAAVMTSLFLVEGRNLPDKISCTFILRGKQVTATAAVNETTPVAPSPMPGPIHQARPNGEITAGGQPGKPTPLLPLGERTDQAQRVVFQTTPPVIQQVPLTQAQERLLHLLTITSVRSKGVVVSSDPTQNREALSGVFVERFGQWLIVAVAVERRIGVKPVGMEIPTFTIAGTRTAPTAILQPLPASLETKPLLMGLLFLCEHPEAVSMTGNMRIGKEGHQWTTTVAAAPVIPTPGSFPNVAAPPSETSEIIRPSGSGMGLVEPAGKPGNQPVEETSKVVPADNPVSQNRKENIPEKPVPNPARMDSKEIPEVKPATLTVPKAKTSRPGRAGTGAAKPINDRVGDLAAAAMAVEGNPQQRLTVEGVQVKVLEVRTVGEQIWVLGEVVNLNDAEIADFQLVTVKKTATDGMVAHKSIPAELTFVKNNTLQHQGDHTRFGFAINQGFGLLPTELRWKSLGIQQTLEIKLGK